MDREDETNQFGVSLLFGFVFVLQLDIKDTTGADVSPRAIRDHLVHHEEVRSETTQTLHIL